VLRDRELQIGTRNKIFDRAGHHDFLKSSYCSHARSDMNRDADYFVARDFAFPSVQTRTHLKSQRMNAIAHRARTANRPRGSVEGSE
jgi:hypothetical protein